jgi:hypothetical protein
MEYEFEAEIYRAGINACVDVPERITSALERDRGFIHVAGRMGGASFSKSLVPVKGGPYRLYVDEKMLKAAGARAAARSVFAIRQGSRREKPYEMPGFVREALAQRALLERFEALSEARRREALRYLAALRSPEARDRNLEKLIRQLEDGLRDVRVP